MIDNTERQVATRVEGIRPDHRFRYEWVANRMAGKMVVDAACGVGYGSEILAKHGCTVRAYDRDAQTIEFAKRHFNHNPNITYAQGDLYDVEFPTRADAVVCFEAIEHLADPGIALRKFRKMSDTLIASVPNETVFPFKGYRHHFRHYSKKDFEALLNENGWAVEEWWGQEGTSSNLERDLEGRTLIAVAKRVDKDFVAPSHSVELTPEDILGGPVPASVSIVALGGSRDMYFGETLKAWGRNAVSHETWAINAMGGLIQFDRLFHMDDVRIQEGRAENGHKGVATMLDWMKKCDKPIYTSRSHEDYPTTQDYPLEWVLNRVHMPYMNSTIAYALALAIAVGVKEIGLYGCDFSYPQAHKRERGRGCIEFWVAIALSRGITIKYNPHTTLLDWNMPERDRLYGYDTEWVTIEKKDNGKVRVVRTERSAEDVPTPEQIEVRYSHDPNRDSGS